MIMSLKDALHHYLSVRDGRTDASFMVAARTPASFHETSGMSELWREHERIEKGIECSGSCERSFLDLKIEIAERILGECSLCPWRCKVNRHREQGHCGVMEPRVASEFLHYGEEAPLVPSHTIFFSGCTLRCVFCQNWDISQNPSAGRHIEVDELAALIEERRRMGAANVNFVGGDPTPALPYILRVLSRVSISVPVVWNSNMYMTRESLRLIMGAADLYLTDFKFGNSECAERLAGAGNYFEVVSRNHLMIAGEDMIIRHLVLPGHLECCTKPIISWVAENLGTDTVMNIMGQYRPLYRASAYPEINRPLYIEELEEARRWAMSEGLENLI
ncbi:MAG TPA: radical SAM protein [Methanothermobacter thermautotrophicus]|nr:radical SAM protein [Methanothermobacter thermautotrophicus]